MRYPLLSSIVLLLGGCAGLGGGPEGPLEELDPSGLEEGHGYLVVGYHANAPVDQLRFKGPDDLVSKVFTEDIPKGETVEFFSLPAGRYELTRIYTIRRPITLYLDLESQRQNWGFEVTPGKITYIGHLLIERGFPYRFPSIRRTNRSAMLLQHLSENDPGKLEAGDYVFSGGAPDKFLPYIEEGRREVSE